jgi:dihydrofolate reductase
MTQSARRLRYCVATSLDGYIAGPNGEADWITMDPDIDFNAFFEQFDTFLMGRRTFEAMQGQGGGGAGGSTIYVVSRTLELKKPKKGVTIIRDDVAAQVAALKAKPGKDIWLFGGGDLFRSLSGMGLVDSMSVAVIPIMLGGGLPLFPAPAGRVPLKLVKQQVYKKSGIVSLEYELVRKAAKKRRTA